MGYLKRRGSIKISKTKQKKEAERSFHQDQKSPRLEKSKVSPSREAGIPQVDRKAFLAQSKEMEKIISLLRSTPELRTERINEIKKLIQEKRYQIDSNAIAKKMIKYFLLEREKE